MQCKEDGKIDKNDPVGSLLDCMIPAWNHALRPEEKKIIVDNSVKYSIHCHLCVQMFLLYNVYFLGINSVPFKIIFYLFIPLFTLYFETFSFLLLILGR